MTQLKDEHRGIFDKTFSYEVERAWEDLSPPDEFDLKRLKQLMWGIIKRIGYYPTSVVVYNDMSGCVVYAQDVFIGCCDDADPDDNRVSVMCRSDESLNVSYIGPLSIPDGIVNHLRDTRADWDLSFNSSPWKLSPEAVASDTEQLANLPDPEKEALLKSLKGFTEMSGAFDHGA